jgi:shikimate kinase
MVNGATQKAAENGQDPALAAAVTRALGRRSIVLVGMMGAGKSSVGRRLAARVIARLLESGPQVLATGGGAVMDQRTRDLIHIKGVSVWLKADLDVLMKRTKRRNDRPLADKMKDLLPQREPVYAQSDIIIQSRDEPHDLIVEEVIAAAARHLHAAPEARP